MQLFIQQTRLTETLQRLKQGAFLHIGIISIAFFMQFFFLGYGYSLPVHSDLLPILKHDRNPELYAHDWRVGLDSELTGTRGMYSYFFGNLSKPLPLPVFELVMYVIVRFALQAGLYFLSWQLFKDWRAALLACMIINLFYIQMGSHSFYSRGPLITSDLAEAMLLWGLVLFRRRPFWFAVVAGLAAVIHVNFGALGMLLYSLATLFPIRLDRAWLRHQVLLVVGFGIGFAPFLVNIGQFLDRSNQVVGAEYTKDILLARAPWHFDPFSASQNLPEFALIVLLFFVVARQYQGEAHTFYRRFGAATLLLIVLELCLNNPFVRVGTIMTLHLIRVVVFLMVLMVIYAAHFLVTKVSQLERPTLWLGLIPVAALFGYIFDPTLVARGRELTWLYPTFYLLLGSLVFWFLTRHVKSSGRFWLGATLPALMLLFGTVQTLRQPPEFVFDEKVQLPDDEMAFWIRDHTDQDAIIIIYPLYERFQSLSERAIIAERASLPHPFALEWVERNLDVLGVQIKEGESPRPYIKKLADYSFWDTSYDALDEERAMFLKEKYGADYVVVKDDHDLKLKEVHRCCGLILYEIEAP